ncbi:transposase family protein [Candidatus Pacearchaeota archaeon]|nr:transposase family protein [Candidatus Pacearchaeota archaeon]
MLHADWLENKGIHTIAYIDDASRNILFIGEFNNATTDNAIITLKEAEKQVQELNGSIQAINTDRGSHFYPNKRDNNGRADSVYQNYFRSRGIKHIPSKRNNPQTNGKIERWFQEYLRLFFKANGW